MPKTKISEYSTTNSSNTDINSINIDEGCAPSGINNAIREIMVHLRNFQTNASGDGATLASLVVQGTGSFTGAVTMSAGATLSGTNTMSGTNIISGNSTISGNINSSGTNTFSGSQVISGNINSSGTNTFSGSTTFSGNLSASTTSLGALSASTLSLSTALGVANGGTGTTTLTSNNVLIGNGTSAVQFVAPGTSGNVLTSNGTTWASTAPAVLTRETAKASTSGAEVDFTGIPATAKRITIILSGVSTNSTSPIQIQLGDAGGIENTGYVGFNSAHGTGTASVGFTAAFGVTVSTSYTSAAKTYSGNLTLTNVSGNTWIASGVFASDAYTYTTAGAKTLSDVLTQVRVTTANGTDTFDAGLVNIMYE